MKEEIHLSLDKATLLKENFAALFDDISTAKTVAIESGININNINLNSNLYSIWREIVNEAKKNELVVELILSALKYYPNGAYSRRLRNILHELISEEKLKKASININFNSFIKSSPFEKQIGENLDLVKVSIMKKVIENYLYVGRIYYKPIEKFIGTGFLLKNGYLLTNFHVISSKEDLKNSFIEFKYTEYGAKTITLNFEEDFIISSKNPDDDDMIPNKNNLDYSLLKVKGKYEELSHARIILDSSLPALNSPIYIIQHPNGGPVQAAVNSNQIINIWKHYIYYNADTEVGSSGSPLFNQNWEVIGLHHGGKSGRNGEGLMQINSIQEKIPANRGILLNAIINDLTEKKFPVQVIL